MLHTQLPYDQWPSSDMSNSEASTPLGTILPRGDETYKYTYDMPLYDFPRTLGNNYPPLSVLSFPICDDQEGRSLFPPVHKLHTQ